MAINAADVIEKEVGPKSETSAETKPAPKPESYEEKLAKTSKSIFNTQKETDGWKPGTGKDESDKESPPVTNAEATPDPPVPADASRHTKLPEDIFTPDEPTPTKPVQEDEAIKEIRESTLPEGTKARTLKSFQQLRDLSVSHLEKANARVRELESKLSQQSGNGAVEDYQKQITQERQKYAELEERFGRALFTESPRFQQMFSEPEKAAIDGAKAYLEGTEINPNLVDVIIHATPKRRLDMLNEAGATPDQIAAIVAQISRYDDIQRSKGKAIENWKTDVAQMSEQETAYRQQQEEKRRQEEETIWEQVVSSADLLPLKKSKNDQAWNNRIPEIIQKAKTDFNGNEATLPDLGLVILKGRAYDALSEVVDKLTERLNNLISEGAKLKAVKPGGEMTQAIPGIGKPDLSKMSPDEVSAAIFRANQGKAQG